MKKIEGQGRFLDDLLYAREFFFIDGRNFHAMGGWASKVLDLFAGVDLWFFTC